MPDRDPLLDLSEAVADGTSVDWARERDASGELRTLEELRVIEAIAAAHRSSAPGAQAGDGTSPHPPGTTWGPLVVLEPIGEGRFGRVYRARDLHLQRDVALKLLRPRDGHSAGGSLVTEARLLARVRHPNVVTVHGADVIAGEIGLWMELVQGQTLASWVATHGPLGPEEAAAIGATLCRAVAAVHQSGLLHRDIKAQNVVREPGGRIVLMDFGAGWDLLDPSASRRAVGTPVYVAPEVLAGNVPTAASDIYSLGVLLFFVTTQNYPVVATTLEELIERHAKRDQLQLRDLRPDLPSRFVEVVSKAIAIDPKERFESAGRLEQALLGSLSGTRSAVAPVSVSTPIVTGDRTQALQPGARLGAYEVVRSLAAGGMGEVYLARDIRLDREVALKVIAPELAGDPARLERFAREAKTASRLNHPGIAHIYEIGEAGGVRFIAMEYVRGDELRLRIAGRGLPMSEVIIYATQIADALDEAHTHGIVHRDLKPSNAIVTSRGRIKVLDFGLAKIMPTADRPDDGRSTEPGLTDVGLVLGTVDYMSPEQVRGLAVDRRSDIFSFGVMLYEMITGRLPFTATTKTDLVFRITQAQPEPLSRYSYDVPPELDRIVRKCLEKEPSRRYQSARDLLVDLSGLKRDSGSGTIAVMAAPPAWSPRGVAAVIMSALIAMALIGTAAYRYWRAPDAIDSLAVLPDLGSGANRDASVAASALANRIANTLSVIGSVRVAPHIHAAGTAETDPLSEARQLGVHGALLVTVDIVNGMAALDLRLVDVVHHPRQDWAQQYKVPVSEIDLAQEHIAAQVAETLNLRFDAEQRRALKVYQLVQRGRSYLPQRTESDLRRAIEFFNLAIDADPSYARAYAGLAQAHNLLHLYSMVKPADAAPEAKKAAERALALDDHLADAYTQRALISFRWEWNWKQAEQEFARAVSLDKGDTDARHWAAMFYTADSRFNDAITLIREAQAIDPLDQVVAADPGWILYMARRYEEAAADAQRSIEARPDSILPHWYLGLSMIQLHQYALAVKSFEKAVAMSDGQTTYRAELASALASAGRRTEAIRIRDELLQAGTKTGFIPAYHMSLIAAALNDPKSSLEWLKTAAQDREGLLVWIGLEPRFDALRKDPEFQKIVEAIRGQ